MDWIIHLNGADHESICKIIAQKSLLVSQNTILNHGVMEITEECPNIKDSVDPAEVFSKYLVLRKLFENETFNLENENHLVLFLELGYILMRDKSLLNEERFEITKIFFSLKGTNNFFQYFRIKDLYNIKAYGEEYEDIKQTIRKKKDFLVKLKELFPEDTKKVSDLPLGHPDLTPLALKFSRILIEMDLSPYILYA